MTGGTVLGTRRHTCAQMLVRIHTRVPSLREQIESEVIFSLRQTRRQAEVNRAGQTPLQNYNAVILNRKDCS